MWRHNSSRHPFSANDWTDHLIICSLNCTWRLDSSRHPFSSVDWTDPFTIRPFNGRHWLFHPFKHDMSFIKRISLGFFRTMADNGSFFLIYYMSFLEWTLLEFVWPMADRGNPLFHLCYRIDYLMFRSVNDTWFNISCLHVFSVINWTDPFRIRSFNVTQRYNSSLHPFLSQLLDGSFYYLFFQWPWLIPPFALRRWSNGFF